MNAQIELIEGTNRDTSLSQFFTPPKLAAKLVAWAGIHQKTELKHGIVTGFHPMRVLEPSAGNGAIVRELVKAGAEVSYVELDERYTRELMDASGHGGCTGRDFLTMRPDEYEHRFDQCVGNFPFHLDLTGAFTLHALEFAPRVCAIYPANFFYSEQREELWKQVRPTRVAHISKRPWPGATDYVALELVPIRHPAERFWHDCRVEWWHEAWG